MHPDTESPSSAKAALGRELSRLFAETEAARRETEERWLRDLRQYKGLHEPEVRSRLGARRSSAYLRLTRAKVRVADARLMDLLFPGGSDRNWSIEPTPVPDLHPAARAALAARLERSAGGVASETPEAMDGLLLESARKACRAMEREMRDQLAESRYREVVRDVIHSGNLYGTGVLKGPLVELRAGAAWEPTADGWSAGTRERLAPSVEFVPVWDVYPDMEARDIREARFVFQRHRVSPRELEALAARPDFDAQAVAAVARRASAAPAEREHERELRDMGRRGRPRDAGGRVELLEYWGFAGPDELTALGLLAEGEERRAQTPMNVWLCGDAVLKLTRAPLPAQGWPYHFYSFDRDETSIFGEGIASVMRDPQQMFNASVRAMLDNAAICSGPQIEVNQDLLPEGEDPTDVFPFRVWLRSGAGSDAAAPAVRVSSMPSYTDEFMAMARLFEAYAHETTGIPSAMQSELDKAAGTVRGLSMLMGATSVGLKDQLRHFDDGVTRPFVAALYHWNMRFGSDERIKGDFAVQARGWTTLMSRELAVDQLDAFAASTANALDAPWIRRGELLRRRALARDLGEDIVKNEEEMAAEISLLAADGGRP